MVESSFEESDEGSEFRQLTQIRHHPTEFPLPSYPPGHANRTLSFLPSPCLHR